MAEMKRFKGLIQLRIDEQSAWDTTGLILKKGEVGFITEENVVTKFIVGDGVSNPSVLTESSCFHSGIGAGYTLPAATVDALGGIRINDIYFEMSNGFLNPKTIFYSTEPIKYNNDNKSEHLPWTTLEDSDLRVCGDLYAEDIYADVAHIKELDYEITVTYPSNYYEIHKQQESGELPNVLGDNEYIGLRLFNYANAPAETEDTELNRPTAELSINKDGILFYTPDYKTLNRRLVANIDSEYDSGILLFDSTASSFYTGKINSENIDSLSTLTLHTTGEESYVYDPLAQEGLEITLNIPTNYCETIIANGTEYRLEEDGRTIKLGETAWTDELKGQLDAAVKKVTVGGTDISGPDIILQSSDSSVTITTEEKTIDIKHYEVNSIQPSKTRYEVGNLTEVDVVNEIDYDERGHINSASIMTVSFEQLLARIADLEARIAELENK